MLPSPKGLSLEFENGKIKYFFQLSLFSLETVKD